MAEELKAKAPKGAWVVMVCTFIAGIAMAFAQYKVTGCMGAVLEEFQVSKAIGGWIMSVFSVMGIILAFPSVAIIKKFGLKTTGIIALAFAIVGGIIGFFSTGQIPLMVSRVVEGFGLGIVNVLAPTAIAMWFPVEKRGAPMGIWSCWQMVGISATFFFAVPLTAMFGTWKGLWIVGVVVLIVAIILYALFVREPAPENNYADLTAESEGQSVGMFAAMKYKNAWLMCLAGFAFGISNSTVIAWAASYWTESGAFSADFANYMASFMFFIEVWGCIVAGVILNKIQKRRRFQVIDSALYACCFILIFNSGGSFAFALFSVIAYAIIECGFCAGMWTLCPQAVPDTRAIASMTAGFGVAVNFGMMLGSPLGGAIIDAAGYSYLCITVVIAQVISTVCYGFVKMYDANGNAVKI